MAKLDIMMPFYGRVDHMKLAVESVLSQSSPDWRLVVLDDGYPDDSIPGWFASIGDSRVVYLRNESQLGANGNYRKCLGMVETPWFVMMGADDIMKSNFVAETLSLIKRYPTAGVLHLGGDVIDENGKVWLPLVDKVKARLRPSVTSHEVEIQPQEISESLLRGDWMYFPSIVWNTDAVKKIGFRTEYDVVQDLALALDVVASGKTFVLSDKDVFSYRRHSQSDSSWRALKGSRFIEEANFLNAISREMKQRGWKKASRIARSHWTSRMNSFLFIFKALGKGEFRGAAVLTKATFM